MGTSDEIKTIQPEGEIYTCPICNYTDGFHIAFKMKVKKTAEIILICPSCHRRFLINLKVNLD